MRVYRSSIRGVVLFCSRLLAFGFLPLWRLLTSDRRRASLRMKGAGRHNDRSADLLRRVREQLHLLLTKRARPLEIDTDDHHVAVLLHARHQHGVELPGFPAQDHKQDSQQENAIWGIEKEGDVPCLVRSLKRTFFLARERNGCHLCIPAVTNDKEAQPTKQ
jgi:hypothetical protein